MIKLVAIDLDGTLLNKNKEISSKDQWAIKVAMEKGIIILIATGRAYEGAKYYACALGISGPVICYNGAMIREVASNRILYTHSLHNELAFKVCRQCVENEIYFQAYVGDMIYADHNQFSRRYYHLNQNSIPDHNKSKIHLKENLCIYVKESLEAVHKIICVHPDKEKLSSFRIELGYADKIDLIRSESNNFEVLSRGVNKGTALEKISEIMGINSDEIIAIGDQENDLPMLQYAGFAAAVNNANEKVRNNAKYITVSNEHSPIHDLFTMHLFK